MAVDGLIQTFRALDAKSRSHALAALLRELTAQEWRDLKLLAGTKTLQCDIVGRLPVELVLNIFSFLDIAVLCRLQTVSKRWHSILSSSDFLDQALRRWYGAPLVFRHNDHDKALRLKMAEHVHRFHTGRPYSFGKVRVGYHSSYAIQSILVDDNFLYLKQGDRSIFVKNLRTSACFGISTPKQIRSFTASSELIAVATYQECYVCPYSEDIGSRKKFRIPYVGTERALTCSGRTVVHSATSGITLTARRHHEDLTVYVFDYDSGKGHLFNAQHGPAASSNQQLRWEPRVLLDSKSSTVTAICYEDNPEHDRTFIHYSTYTLSGEKISDGANTMPLLKRPSVVNTCILDCTGTTAVQIASNQGDCTLTLAFALCHSPTENKFFLKEVFHMSPIINSRGPVAYWKDVAYQASHIEQGFFVTSPSQGVASNIAKAIRFDSISRSVADARGLGTESDAHRGDWQERIPWLLDHPVVVHLNENILLTGPHHGDCYIFYSFDPDLICKEL